jgi:hypothetical protein
MPPVIARDGGEERRGGDSHAQDAVPDLRKRFPVATSTSSAVPNAASGPRRSSRGRARRSGRTRECWSASAPPRCGDRPDRGTRDASACRRRADRAPPTTSTGDAASARSGYASGAACLPRCWATAWSSSFARSQVNTVCSERIGDLELPAVLEPQTARDRSSRGRGPAPWRPRRITAPLAVCG